MSLRQRRAGADAGDKPLSEAAGTAAAAKAEAKPSEITTAEEQPDPTPEPKDEKSQSPKTDFKVFAYKYLYRMETVFAVSVTTVCTILLILLVDRTPPDQKLFTKDVLQMYKGERGNPYYLAILGEVFDVTKGKSHYGEGGYSFFLGTDASRAFVTGKFKLDLTDEVDDFDAEQCASLVGWHAFFRKTYTFKGRVIGRFYNKAGKATRLYHKVYELAKKAKTEEDRQREFEASLVACNVRWTEAEGGTVWCDNGMYPRKLTLQTSGGKPNVRCACFKEVGWSDVRQIYEGCGPEATSCKVSPPAASSHSATD